MIWWLKAPVRIRALSSTFIQNVDRKLPLDDIASAKGLEIGELVKEMEQIVFSGTKTEHRLLDRRSA